MKKLLPVFLALAGLAMAACGATGTTAATVNGNRISQASLDEELEEIGGNDEYRTAIDESLEARGETYKVRGQGEGTFSSSFAATVLTRRVYFELVSEEAERRKIRLTDDDLEQARFSLAAQVGDDDGQPDPQDVERGLAILGRFSKGYQRDLQRRQAQVERLQAVLADVDISSAGLRKAFDERKDEFAEACVMHVLVDTDKDAERVRTELSGGADFAEVAVSRSKDPSAQQNKGDLGCRPPDEFVVEFADAARTIPIGELSQPVQTQFGWHVLKVYERRTPPFNELRARIRAELLDQGADDLSIWLEEALSKADVDVNPKYGKFSRDDARPRIVPPEAPRAAVTTTTVTPGSPPPTG